MIRRRTPKPDAEEAPPKGFDDFDLKLGDIMRGERATMGKSLLDVQRELKIKATYIAAIENSDPSAFETPGFIAGYVRSYARYLALDPEWAFETFCREADFATLSGLEQNGRKGEASKVSKEATAAADGALGGMLTRLKGGGPKQAGKPKSRPVTRVAGARDPFAEPNVTFTPRGDSMFSRIEPGAIGSSLVLLALIGAVGYGGWAVLQQVQRVSVAPVEEAPGVVADIDPLAAPTLTDTPAPEYAGVAAATPDALDRLYRPQALDTPVMTPRDGPIAALDPSTQGALAPGAAAGSAPGAELVAGTTGEVHRDDGTELASADVLELFATAPAWVRVQDAEGNILFEKTLNAGERWIVPEGEAGSDDVAVLRTGAAGAVYFAMDGKTYGPAGPRGNVVSDLALDRDALRDAFTVADAGRDGALDRVLAEAPQKPLNAPENYEELRAAAEAIVANAPKVTADGKPVVELVAVRPSWVRVRAADGSTIYERTMQPGDRYTLPQAEVAATLRTGDAGSVYVVAAGQAYGPIGSRGEVVSNFALSAEGATESLAVADLSRDPALQSVMVAENGPLVSE
ncbi:helix-turn-helix domain-containing protein [Vannielia litorea]|uniref:helix-turn-helix domain-containing protein n=1 Tax=Vannielia litorea TaxID=1217970 RepID=UPI001BCE9E1D|nr:helix-turn-helix domain-containing protein [Vannielia litorea]MBS8228727.1 helix-turn-helix domain-containing protein [Vannielia litorea]